MARRQSGAHRLWLSRDRSTMAGTRANTGDGEHSQMVGSPVVGLRLGAHIHQDVRHNRSHLANRLGVLAIAFDCGSGYTGFFGDNIGGFEVGFILIPTSSTPLPSIMFCFFPCVVHPSAQFAGICRRQIATAQQFHTNPVV